MLLIFPVCDRVELLPYFLPYYKSLGVKKFVCGLYNGEHNPLYRNISKFSRKYDLTIRNSVLTGVPDHYNCAIDHPGLNRIREEFTGRQEWYAIADLDEFHFLHGFTLPEVAGEADAHGYEAVHGVFFDRISRDGSFPKIKGSLDKTFPLACNLTAQTKLAFGKIVMAKSHVPIEYGHHTAHAKVWFNFAQVHHFKWSHGVNRRVAAYHEKGKELGIGWRIEKLPEMINLIQDGINLRNPKLVVGEAQKLGI